MSDAKHGHEHGGAKGEGHDAHAAGHDAHPAGHGGHGGHGKHGGHEEHGHHGPPPWLMSFGDMMTLFLCFFIILVTMADKQEGGLMAAGLGPFVTALEYHGLDGALTGEQRLQAVNTFRERFGLPPEVDSARAERNVQFRDTAELEALVGNALRPHAELALPSVALFDADSAELSPISRRYLDRVAETLRPSFGQLLILDGHASDAGWHFRESDTELALARAAAVRQYLIEQHEFVPQRVDARVYASERGAPAEVGARLVEPIREQPRVESESDG